LLYVANINIKFSVTEDKTLTELRNSCNRIILGFDCSVHIGNNYVQINYDILWIEEEYVEIYYYYYA
jgi:hypothetical protein